MASEEKSSAQPFALQNSTSAVENGTTELHQTLTFDDTQSDGKRSPNDQEASRTLALEESGVIVPSDEEECPEGGRQAWLVLTGSFLIYFVTFGVINSYGTFQVSL